MKKPPAASVCWHESAHAAVVFATGGELTFISARPDPDRQLWGGITAWRRAAEPRPEVDAMIAFAGPIAEERYGDAEPRASLASARPLSPRDDDDVAALGTGLVNRFNLYGPDPDDVEAAADAIRTLAPESPVAQAIISARLRQRTRDLVASRRVGHLIEQLASQLDECGSLDGEAATAVLERANQQYDRWVQAATSSPAEWGEDDPNDPPIATPGMAADADAGFFKAADVNPGPGERRKISDKNRMVEPKDGVSGVTTPC